jgi:hypothetical protein
MHYDKRKNMTKSIADELEGNFGLMPEFFPGNHTTKA